MIHLNESVFNGISSSCTVQFSNKFSKIYVSNNSKTTTERLSILKIKCELVIPVMCNPDADFMSLK